MTEAEKSHLAKIRQMWIEDDSPKNWELKISVSRGVEFNAKMVDGKLYWFDYQKMHGLERVKVEEML